MENPDNLQKDPVFYYQPDNRNAIRLPRGWNSWREIMRLLLHSAGKCGNEGEIPVAAALLDLENGDILGKGKNSSISENDPTAHAEIKALRQAGKIRNNYRFPGSVLVVTLEPCLMCLGAMVQARIDGLIFGAFDSRTGAVTSCLDYKGLNWLNNRFWVLGGVMNQQSASLLQGFFRRRRMRRGSEVRP